MAAARARNLEVAIDKKRIVAPFRARIGITDLQPGAYLDAGTRIATLQGVDNDVYTDFALPQDSAATIRKGSTVTISSAAVPGEEAAVKIVAESESVDRSNRMVQFRAVAAGLGEAVRSGMFVDVVAVVSAPRPAVLVPLTAVRRSPYGEHFFRLVVEGGKLRARASKAFGPDLCRGRTSSFLDGLKPGDPIAAAGAFNLRDGLLVRTEIPPVASAAPSVN